MITKTKQDIDNIVVKARDYIEAHVATDWSNWSEDYVNTLTDDDGLLKVAILDQFLRSYEGEHIIKFGSDQYVWPFTVDKYANDLVEQLEDYNVRLVA